MIKSELVQKIAEKNPHLYHRDIERIVNTVLDEIINALKEGDRVELRGFGAFSAKARPTWRATSVLLPLSFRARLEADTRVTPFSSSMIWA